MKITNFSTKSVNRLWLTNLYNYDKSNLKQPLYINKTLDLLALRKSFRKIKFNNSGIFFKLGDILLDELINSRLYLLVYM